MLLNPTLLSEGANFLTSYQALNYMSKGLDNI
jgi:hypothetical protein